MSFAVIQTGGKQYKVKTNDILKIEKLSDIKDDKKIEFSNILACGDENNFEVGSPTVSGAKVEAELIKNGKNRTVLIFKKRRRKNSRRKYGHRQPISVIQITKIISKEGKVIAQSEEKKKPIEQEKTDKKTKEIKKSSLTNKKK